MNPRPTGAKRVRALATMLCTIGALVVVPPTFTAGAQEANPAAAANATAATNTAENAAEKGAITWGFRESFVNYIGGPHTVSEGATYDNKRAAFPVDSVEVTGNRVELRGHGRVLFAQYCKDESDTETCDLNLTFSNPRIVIDGDHPDQSGIYYTVRTKDYQTKVISGPEERHMAQLHPELATENAWEGGVVKIKGIPAVLTEDGAKVFSGFYDVGTALAPLDVEYSGDAVTIDNAPYEVGNSWNSKLENGDLHYTRAVGDKVMHAAQGYWGSGPATITILDSDLNPLSTTTVNAGPRMSVAVNGNDIFYWDGQAFWKVTVQEDGTLSEPADLGVTADDLIDLTVRPDGTLAAIAQGGVFITVAPDGTTNTRQLPEPTQVSKVLSARADAASLDVSNYYGESGQKSARTLAPLPDGSFIYAPAGSVYDEEYNQVLRGQLLHITEDGQVTEMPLENAVDTTMLNLAVYGNTIYRWNNSWNTYSRRQISTYDNGTVTILVDGREDEQTSEIAGIVPVGDGTFTVDAANGRLLWRDASGAITNEMPFAKVEDSAKNNQVTVLLPNGNIMFPTVITNDDYEDELYLNILRPRTTELPDAGENREPTPTTTPEETTTSAAPTTAVEPTTSAPAPTTTSSPVKTTTTKAPVTKTSTTKAPAGKGDPEVVGSSVWHAVVPLLIGLVGLLAFVGTILGIPHTLLGGVQPR